MRPSTATCITEYGECDRVQLYVHDSGSIILGCSFSREKGKLESSFRSYSTLVLIICTTDKQAHHTLIYPYTHTRTLPTYLTTFEHTVFPPVALSDESLVH
jgi:hypothetical protein